MEKTIFHIDVNSAFLSWSAIDTLKTENSEDLRNIPSAVGGDSTSRRGIILAKSTPAKAYNIVTGEPIAMALRKCPSLIVVKPNYNLYSHYSKELFKLLSKYSDRIEIFSIDECFLDYTGMELLFGSPLDAAYKIKADIKKTLGFTVNIGIGPNKLLAKMAGDLEKPDKVITLYANELKEKFWPLPVSSLFMVGGKTATKLNKMGIFTIEQLATYNFNILEKEFKNTALTLKNYANGISESDIAFAGSMHQYKSISNSITTPADITKKEDAHEIFLSIAHNIGHRLRKHKKFANSISVTIKNNQFKSYSHQRATKNGLDTTQAIYETAINIFNEMWKQEPIRLLGISADKLSDFASSQLDFHQDNCEKERLAELAMDKVNIALGCEKVTRCALLHSPIKIGKGSSFSKDR